MKRGEIVLLAIQGDYGKPRPAVVIQSDLFNAHHPSIAVCPVTSELRDTPLFRLTIEPAPGNGLTRLSQIMADKPITVPRARCKKRIGALEEAQMQRLDRALLMFLGLA